MVIKQSYRKTKIHATPLIITAIFVVFSCAVIIIHFILTYHGERKILENSYCNSIGNSISKNIDGLFVYANSISFLKDFNKSELLEAQLLQLNGHIFPYDMSKFQFIDVSIKDEKFYFDRFYSVTKTNNFDSNAWKQYKDLLNNKKNIQYCKTTHWFILDDVEINGEKNIILCVPTHKNKTNNQYNVICIICPLNYIFDGIDWKIYKDSKILITGIEGQEILCNNKSIEIDKNKNYTSAIIDLHSGNWKVNAYTPYKLLSILSESYLLVFWLLISGIIFLLLIDIIYIHTTTSKSRYYSKLREINDIMRQQSAEINNNNKKLKQINETKDRFFSIIAHDLRNPITAMINISEIFNDYLDKMNMTEIKNTSKILTNATTHIGRLLENLLEWSRINMDGMQYTPMSCNLNEIVKIVIEQLNTISNAKQIKIIVNMPDDIFVYCDINMMHTIIRNIISNAIKFSYPEDSIIISTIQKPEDVYVISIQDYGIGMSTEQVNKLFLIDEKITTKGTKGEIGTGLGLAITKDFLAKHDQKIWVSSKPNMGTTFFFTLKKAHH